MSYIGDNDSDLTSLSIKIRNTPVKCVNKIGCKRFYRQCSNEERQKSVKQAFVFAWDNYRRYAWGHDHLHPDSKAYDDELIGLGATLVDSLTALLLFNLTEHFDLSKEWLQTSLKFDKSLKDKASMFEITIRMIGGLTSTYHLTGDTFFLDKAKEIADLTLKCFDDDTGIPHMGVIWADGKCVANHFEKCLFSDCSHTGNCTFLYCTAQVAEVGTLGLEFRGLSYASGEEVYARYINRTTNVLLEYDDWDGLVGRNFYVDEGQYVLGEDISLGPGVDSYYEYLLKQWVQSAFQADRFKQAYLRAVDGIYKHLMLRVQVRDKSLHVLGMRMQNVTLIGEIHHLSCFLPGTLALGYYHGLPKYHLELAEDIMESCYYLYESQPTGLAADFSRFESQGVVPIYAQNFLRPEAVESLFVLWRVTKKEKYREWAWNIFQAFERVSRTCHGYSSIGNVGDIHTTFLDKQESYFLAETLKYFYLIFEEDDEVLSFDKWVLNTEAHPLPIMRDYEGVY